MKIFIVIGIVALLLACAPEATVIWPDGSTFVVKANKRGMLIEAKDGQGREVKVDDRGKPSILRTIVEAGAVQAMTKD